MISVIITTHNGRKDRCQKAIQSVLNQTFQDFEIVVVDDASKDGTDKMIRAFNEPRIVYIYRKTNFGNDTKPKNEGIIASKGEYIAFLDSDNAYRPDHLQALYNEMKKSEENRTGVLVDKRIKGRGWDVVYGDRWLHDETGKIQDQIGISHDFDPALLMQRNFIDTSDVLIRKKSLFDIGGFDESIKKYIDWNLWCRMSKAGKTFKRVPIILTNYTLHEDMKSLKVKTKGENKNPNSFIPEWDAYDCPVELPYLGKKIIEPKVAIFTLTMNRLEETKACFESLHKTAGYEFDHFVIDNGSTDGTKDWLDTKPYENITCLYNPENEGISRASNKVIELIKSDNYDIIIKVDNDAIFITEGWLSKMVEIWKSNHMIAMSPYVQGLKDNVGGSPRFEYGYVKDQYVGVVQHLGGICCFADAHAYDTFRWDEESFLHGVQDMEFSQYLKFNGYTMIYLENYYVNHGKGGTEDQHKRYPAYFEKRKLEKTIKYEKNG